MKRVCIIAVCYNAFEETVKYLDSIEEAYSQVADVELTVVLSDNSLKNVPGELIEREMQFDYRYIKNDNVGYFPGFCLGLEEVDKDEFDYIIISNVDLEMSVDFFVNLSKQSFSENVAVIAPAIISMADGRDLNPKILTRPSRKKLKLLMHLFSFPYFFRFYVALAKCKEFIKAKNNEPVLPDIKKEEIYAPHGSFIIFTKEYSKIENGFDYPRFLFGEEVHVGEVVRRNNLKVEYNNTLVIRDIEHGSTSLAAVRFLSKHHVLSYKFLINKYFTVE